ncbi:MAG: carboxylating nicotinate-nucleotide diphosphorylase [Promethearchaeia archaeon]
MEKKNNEEYINLKVKEAKKRDIGRNVIRINKEIMEKFNIETGDIVEIRGDKKSTAVVWPGYPEDEDLQIARIDSHIRENTGTIIDDPINIIKVRAKDAKKITLTIENARITPDDKFESFIKRRLHNVPITLKDKILISMGVTREFKLKVTDIEPEDVCMITPDTKISIIDQLPEGVDEPINKNYNIINVEDKLREFIKEDCQFKDITSSFIPTDNINAKIIAKSNGYISGLIFFRVLCNMCDIKANFLKLDGEILKKGDIIGNLEGNARNILLIERIGLNLLTHMSAITSTTREYVNVIKKMNKRTRIAGTRKTLPGLRIFEKAAIEIGGGDPHRFSLDDMILLKDTHLRYYEGKIEALLKDVKEKASFTKKIEIEIEKVDDVLTAAKNGADIIMLDNMNAKEVKEAIKLLKEHHLREKVLIEISGGINIDNIGSYLEVEPDIISTSHLTQFPSEKVDLSLRFY